MFPHIFHKFTPNLPFFMSILLKVPFLLIFRLILWKVWNTIGWQSNKNRKKHGYEVASYSGYTFEELLTGTPDQQELLRHIDVLIDGPFLLSERSLELNFRGSRNQRILNVPKSLERFFPVPETSPRWLGVY